MLAVLSLHSSEISLGKTISVESVVSNSSDEEERDRGSSVTSLGASPSVEIEFSSTRERSEELSSKSGTSSMLERESSSVTSKLSFFAGKWR